MPDPTVIAALVALGAYLDRLIAARRRRSEAREKAVTLLIEAISKTRKHIEDARKPLPSLRDREGELADLWATTAAAFVSVESDVAGLLRMKSAAWAEPSHWSARRVQEAGISLEAVETKAQVLLDRWKIDRA